MSNTKPLKLISGFLAVFLLGFFLYGSIAVAANECPQSRKTKTAPSKFLNKGNPLRKEPRHIKKGKVLSHIKAKPVACKQCHGMLGDGNGAMATSLKPKPRNFTCRLTMGKISDGQLFWIIKNGSKGTSMPAYKHLSDEKVWQLIHYIRSLSK